MPIKNQEAAEHRGPPRHVAAQQGDRDVLRVLQLADRFADSGDLVSIRPDVAVIVECAFILAPASLSWVCENIASTPVLGSVAFRPGGRIPE